MMNEDRLSAELRNLLGEQDFVRLVEAFGGTRLYVPSNDGETLLAQEIGPTAAQAIAGRHAGNYLRIPLARELRARHYRAGGASNAEIARRLGMTETGVDKLFRRMPAPPRKGSAPDPRQLTLFND